MERYVLKHLGYKLMKLGAMTKGNIAKHIQEMFCYHNEIKITSGTPPSIRINKNDLTITLPAKLSKRQTFRIITFALIRETLHDFIDESVDQESLFKVFSPIIMAMEKQYFSDVNNEEFH